MAQLKERFQTFEEYLAYDDRTENLYELFKGQLIKLPVEPGLNVEIATLLMTQFMELVGYQRVRGYGLELEVRGEPKNRYPDLTIICPEHVHQLQQRNTVRIWMGAPVLVVEVVSPGDIQHNRDYIAKRWQYQDLGIPEDWIVNPQSAAVLALDLRDSIYAESVTFSGEDFLHSSQLEHRFSIIFLCPT